MIVKIKIKLEPNRKDLDTCFSASLDNIYFDWDDINVKNLLGGGIIEWALNFGLEFTGLLRWAVDNFVRSKINDMITSTIQGLASFNIPL